MFLDFSLTGFFVGENLKRYSTKSSDILKSCALNIKNKTIFSGVSLNFVKKLISAFYGVKLKIFCQI